jgi:hypothetical protein
MMVMVATAGIVRHPSVRNEARQSSSLTDKWGNLDVQMRAAILRDIKLAKMINPALTKAQVLNAMQAVNDEARKELVDVDWSVMGF